MVWYLASFWAGVLLGVLLAAFYCTAGLRRSVWLSSPPQGFFWRHSTILRYGRPKRRRLRGS